MFVQLDVPVSASHRSCGYFSYSIWRIATEQACVGFQWLRLFAIEQLPDRFPGGFPGDVPQRYIKAGECEGDRATASHALRSSRQRCHKRGDVGGILSDS